MKVIEIDLTDSFATIVVSERTGVVYFGKEHVRVYGIRLVGEGKTTTLRIKVMTSDLERMRESNLSFMLIDQ